VTLWTVTAYRFSPGRIDGNIYFLYWLCRVSRYALDWPLPFFVFRQFGTSQKWPRDSSAPTKNWCRSVRTLRYQLFGAEVSWCQTVLVPNCPDTTSAGISYFWQLSNRLVTSILVGLPFLCCWVLPRFCRQNGQSIGELSRQYAECLVGELSNKRTVQ